MKIIKIALIGFLLLLTSSLSAQTDVLNYNHKPTPLDGHSFIRHEDYQNRVLDYPFVREDDILWSKTYIQRIDLRERKNHPLYFPLYPVKIGGGKVRKNLFDHLIDGIRDGSLTAYETEYFDDVKSVEKINKMLFSIESFEFEDIDSGELVVQVDTIRVTNDQIKEYLIVEDRFFDKKRSVIDVRILGICPIVELPDAETGVPVKQKMFWVWIPEARPILANASIYNSNNNVTERLTFDEYFHKRMFSSVITKESNLYDREIYEYKSIRMHQLLEADRIKNDIRNMESDLWEY